MRLRVPELRTVSAHDAAREPGVRGGAPAAPGASSPRQRDAGALSSGEAAGRRPHEVSGGQRQRCSIARALIGAPRLLLLDEPAQGLDAPLRAEFYDVLRQVRADFKTPVLLVTHDLDECFELAEEMLMLREGRIVQSGTPRKVLDQPANLDVARLLGAFNLLAGEIRALDPGRNTSRVQSRGSSSWRAVIFPAN